ncbi:MAG: LysR family transcriptional regulator [Rhodospirillaceae bacterium]|nr:LysR family transcriptional regulator [Rhodospirillaceae bacterium]MCA8934264.1 LysR family transcriptional regulator [Rhodospirillaceae bacterium]
MADLAEHFDPAAPHDAAFLDGPLRRAGKVTNLDVDLLRTFVTIVDSGGFTRAGERLRRTQSTISLQLKRLESQLGQRLLTRSPRGIAVTTDGEVLLAYARKILSINDAAVARLTEPDLTGVVRLGTPEDFATTHLPMVLAGFAESHPQVTLEVHCELTLNLLNGFQNGEYDLALVKREPQGDASGEKVWREALVWVASDRLLIAEDRPIPLVLSPHPCVYRKRALNALDASGRPWRVAYTSPSLAGAQAAVRAGLGAAVLPRDMVPPDFRLLDSHGAFPRLEDTEIALYRAPSGIGKAAERLADHIVRSLETARGHH